MCAGWSIAAPLGITTNNRVPSLEEAVLFVVRLTHRTPTRTKLRLPFMRKWRVVLMRNRGEFLGYVKAASPDAAEIEAAKTFNLIRVAAQEPSAARAGLKGSPLSSTRLRAQSRIPKT
jgi:hypothetical protein